MKRNWLPQTIASGMLLWALYPGNPSGLLYPASLGLLRNTHLPGLSSRKTEKIYLGMDIRNHGPGLQPNI
jgi:hypothetical protein